MNPIPFQCSLNGIIFRSNIDDNIKTQANEKMNGANGKRKQQTANVK